MKKFRSKKIKKKRKFIKFLFIFFFFFSYIFVFRYCASLNRKLEHDILSEKINYIDLDITNVLNSKIEEKLINPINLLENNVKKVNKINKQTTKKSTKKVSKKKNNQTVSYIYDPIIYIYNTHQTEKYKDYSVYDAAYELASKLNNDGLNTYLEEQSISVFLQQNNLKYYKSYEVSKKYLNQARMKYNNLTYFFDIHRDSLNKNKTTLNYNGKSYAKILFIVGLENKNHEENYKNTEKLNSIINKKIPGISKGIMKKQGEGVNGIYNQDISSNLFLIEVGGVDNTKEEVLRSIEIISRSIEEYIRGII